MPGNKDTGCLCKVQRGVTQGNKSPPARRSAGKREPEGAAFWLRISLPESPHPPLNCLLYSCFEEQHTPGRKSPTPSLSQGLPVSHTVSAEVGPCVSATQPRTWNRNSVIVPWKLLFVIFPLIVLQSCHGKPCAAWRFSYGNLLSFKNPFYILKFANLQSWFKNISIGLQTISEPMFHWDNYFCRFSLEYRPFPQHNISIANEKPTYRANIWGQ